ncbi:elongator complex protein 3 [Fuchsiella alkaliacetigena]|uniref:elongator complex protein 3 n=1 Tax=Fuchsiella alkaliacetigena TaxID=957042 RepID=UPI00200B135A|nr:radical SAM protein [Fuchsiella alkaliacetigena]MCK8825729.1 radical SAM protein [Fuchsiella alkaliacetigena]
MAKEHYIIPIFIPHFGCPHDCIFCNQREITGVSGVSVKQVKDRIEEYLETIDHTEAKVEIAFYGGSFTGLEIEEQNRFLEVAVDYYRQGQVDNLRLSTRPDYINVEILNNLAAYGVEVIELGVQSLVAEVLEAAQRGHGVEEVLRASNLIKDFGFQLGIQLMPGLPKATRETMLYSAVKTIELAPDLVRIYPTLVIKDTALAQLYKKGLFTPLTVAEAVEICKEELLLFREAEIPVIRLGLQPSAEVNQESIVAGPFHPAFRQLVESKLVLDKLKQELGSNLRAEVISLKINPRFSSVLRGQKNSNLIDLEQSYQVEVRVETDQQLEFGKIVINEQKLITI